MLQVCNYFRSYGDDRWYTKLLVTTVFLLDVFHSGLLLHSSYKYMHLALYGNSDSLGSLVWTIEIMVLLNGLVAFVVHLYYCVRVYHLTSRKWVTALCLLLSLLRGAFNVVACKTFRQAGRWSVIELTAFRWELSTLLIIGAASDVVIAAAICTALLRMRTGFSLSNRLVDRLVAFTIGSGLLTGVVAVAECVIYLGFQDSAFMILVMITAKVYNNSLLASLNERERTRASVASLAFRLGNCHVESTEPRLPAA